MDIDRFKLVNDLHGHATGDEVLVMVSRTLANALRPHDVVGRWGGEEFLAVVSHVGEGDLERIGNRFRRLVEQSGLLREGGLVGVTISAGAAMALAGDTPASLIERADIMLRRSKESGKNRVTAAA
jgi:diguanylate cyclase (GGDEF)-like protein